jgi:hypothetical protein
VELWRCRSWLLEIVADFRLAADRIAVPAGLIRRVQYQY